MWPGCWCISAAEKKRGPVWLIRWSNGSLWQGHLPPPISLRARIVWGEAVCWFFSIPAYVPVFQLPAASRELPFRPAEIDFSQLASLCHSEIFWLSTWHSSSELNFVKMCYKVSMQHACVFIRESRAGCHAFELQIFFRVVLLLLLLLLLIIIIHLYIVTF